MSAPTLQDWPRMVGTWRDHTGEPTHIELYEDAQNAGHAEMYLCFPNGSKQPARTVSPEPWSHWVSVLTAWQSRAPIQDMRVIQQPPLPWQIEDWQI